MASRSTNAPTPTLPDGTPIIANVRASTTTTTKATKMTMTTTTTLRKMTLRNGGGGGGKTRGNREGTNGYIPPSLGSLVRSRSARSMPRPLICLDYSFPRSLAHASLRIVACSHRCLIRHNPRYVVTRPSSSPVHAHLSPSTSSPRRPQRPIPRLYPPPPLLDTTAVHHPDTSSASSTFPLPPLPPPLSPPPPPTPPLPPLPPANAAPLSCDAPCPAPAAETAPCRTSPSPYPPRAPPSSAPPSSTRRPLPHPHPHPRAPAGADGDIRLAVAASDDTDSTTPTRRHRLDDTDSATPTRRHRLGDADSTTPPRPYRLDAALSRPRRRLNASVSIPTPDDDTRFAATASDDLDSTPPPRLYRLDATPSTARLDHTSTLPGADDGPRLDNAASTAGPLPRQRRVARGLVNNPGLLTPGSSLDGASSRFHPPRLLLDNNSARSTRRP
ncbi:hypothetical protein HETIRDRAFT_433969 [Heterobasidion irregulare TC 32-1]|uniref:Uncharacterized protein n=1 Tax=Heterobasidion irregulare (strain TC 32-1) TaxID=747525 RepID=W4K859_HETIT|nr:uncharacterized protein HETIRDRAFT_433969 [Heterobasidion irregulare TC 32-1]ETW81251.1 hypothetical protein HETIRDRAFT_433969 [Heterobasidion irregulare TC 32-1]